MPWTVALKAHRRGRPQVKAIGFVLCSLQDARPHGSRDSTLSQCDEVDTGREGGKPGKPLRVASGAEPPDIEREQTPPGDIGDLERRGGEVGEREGDGRGNLNWVGAEAFEPEIEAA